jgi:drug/metabolite transporter (DMT)-like permease
MKIKNKNKKIINFRMIQKLIPIVLAFYMAIIDAISLSIIKFVRLEHLKIGFLAIPILIYALHPIIFYKSLKYESLVIMNLLVDVISAILITFVGLYIFKEEVSKRKIWGIIMGIIAVYLLSS